MWILKILFCYGEYKRKSLLTGGDFRFLSCFVIQSYSNTSMVKVLSVSQDKIEQGLPLLKTGSSCEWFKICLILDN